MRKANKITSDKVASAFLFHPKNILIYHKSVNFPKESAHPRTGGSGPGVVGDVMKSMNLAQTQCPLSLMWERG